MCGHCGCHDLAPIGELDAEHDEILELAWTVLMSGADGAALDAAAVDQLIWLLDVHIDKEETGLYPLLRENGDLDETQGHRLERDHVVVRDALVAGQFGRTEYNDLVAHIEEEDDDLFPVAMFGFGDDLLQRMASAHEAAALRAPARPPR